MPIEVNDDDIEVVMLQSINHLLTGEPVVIRSKGVESRKPFVDYKHLQKSDAIYYLNKLSFVEPSAFSYLDLMKKSKNEVFPVIELTDTNPKGQKGLYFNYYIGVLAAHGFKVHISKNLLFGLTVVYEFDWIS